MIERNKGFYCRRIGGSLAVVALAAVAGAGASAQTQPIKLGATAAITGPFAGVCTKMAASAQAVFNKVNAEGGVNGRKIEWTVLDDGADPQRGVSNTRRLINDGIVTMFLNCGSPGAVASIAETERSKIPNVFMNSVSDAILHPLKSAVFTVLPLFDQQIATVIPFAMKQQGAGTAAVVYLDGYSPNILPGAKYAIEAAGGTMVASIGVALSTTNWGPTVIRLKEANPEFVFLVLTTPGSGQLVAEMANQGFSPKKGVVGAYQMADAIYQQFAGAAGNGTIALSPVVPPSDPKAAECNSVLPAGDTPTFFSVLSCASAKIMVDVLKSAGPDVSASSILAALKNVNGSKAPEFSSIGYSDDHLLVRSMYVWKNGPNGPSLASPDPAPIPDSAKWVK